jgi:predicted ATPase
LALPTEDTPAAAEASPAVSLFVERARAVNASFVLTPANAHDVTEICGRLDGLPLAIELIAARSKVFGPRALLGHLDHVLELRGSGVDRPTRHAALLSTIDWSYRLLTENQRLVFRRMGVFVGGADQAALTEVCGDLAWSREESMEAAVDLVDASMLTVAVDDDGEPRFSMLETIRAFALHLLGEAGELEDSRRRHAMHYREVAELLQAPRVLRTAAELRRAGRLADRELNNLRAALAWATAPGEDSDVIAGSRRALGLALLADVSWLWRHWDLTEASYWLERCVPGETAHQSEDLGRCLAEYAENLLLQEEPVRGLALARRSVEMLRALDSPALPESLVALGEIETELGNPGAGRLALEEALVLARAQGDIMTEGLALEAMAALAMDADDYERALELLREAVDHYLGEGFEYMANQGNINLALGLRRLGRLEEALALMSASLRAWLGVESPLNLAYYAEDYAAMLAESGELSWVPVLLGAADAERARKGVRRDRRQGAHAAEALAAQGVMDPDEWALAYERGHSMLIDDALESAITATTQRVV